MVFCAASALLAACGTDDDPGVNGGGGAGGAGGKRQRGLLRQSRRRRFEHGGQGRRRRPRPRACRRAGEGGNPEPAGAGAGGSAAKAGAAPIVETFTVTLENVAPNKPFTSAGVFDTPVGDLTRGPSNSGQVLQVHGRRRPQAEALLRDHARPPRTTCSSHRTATASRFTSTTARRSPQT